MRADEKLTAFRLAWRSWARRGCFCAPRNLKAWRAAIGSPPPWPVSHVDNPSLVALGGAAPPLDKVEIGFGYRIRTRAHHRFAHASRGAGKSPGIRAAIPTAGRAADSQEPHTDQHRPLPGGQQRFGSGARRRDHHRCAPLPGRIFNAVPFATSSSCCRVGPIAARIPARSNWFTSICFRSAAALIGFPSPS